MSAEWSLDGELLGEQLPEKFKALMRFPNGVVCEANTAGPTRSHEAVLVWDSTPKRLLLVRSKHSLRAGPAQIRQIAEICLRELEAEVFVTADEIELLNDPETNVTLYTKDSLRRTIDAVVCLGGDGLLLHVCSELFVNTVPPILAFNLGSLGFLTPFDFDEHRSHLKRIFRMERHPISLRRRLSCTIHRHESQADGDLKRQISKQFREGEICESSEATRNTYNVLNEMAIDRGPAPFLSNLECWCDGTFVTRIQADGVILATPTGSTAYSLSSGGSMVHPAVSGILMTPVCPHSLSFRPVVFPDSVTLIIRVPIDARCNAWISFDGRNRVELGKGDSVKVNLSAFPVPTFTGESQTKDWFESVRTCLGWNERVAQQPLPLEESPTDDARTSHGGSGKYSMLDDL